MGFGGGSPEQNEAQQRSLRLAIIEAKMKVNKPLTDEDKAIYEEFNDRSIKSQDKVTLAPAGIETPEGDLRGKPLPSGEELLRQRAAQKLAKASGKGPQ